MYAVIFRAEINDLDGAYAAMAVRMRELAMNEYGCSEFTAVTEGTQEIAISYWHDQEQIKQWKQAAEHLVAQRHGRNKWYKSYQVQVVEIIRQYTDSTMGSLL